MGKRCDCVQVCLDNPDKNFEQLIEMGLICERCANSYKEFCKIIREDDKKTDAEIDELVYKIYGVTDEEKKVIEESLK